MIFTSFKFLFFFLPFVYIIFLSLSFFKQTKFISLWLVLASIGFYAFWNPYDIVPLCISIIINYLFYLSIRKDYKPGGKIFLILAISFNVLFLIYFKYIDFFLGEFFSLNMKNNFVNIPLGISFYTFTQIAFLVDCYKNKKYENDFINYFLFVSYFPHLVCGPILSFKELYPQLINKSKFKGSLENLSLFVFCFCIGLFKKAVIGDYLGEYVALVFDADPNATFDSSTALLGTLSYSMQLYFDFSGYSDMAVGLSYLFGLKIPDNFNAPYQATSIIDFWRRWHISLSQFLKAYVYIPLGGSRCHPLIQYRNLWVTMLLGGLWHGASWTFILWGAYHGLLLCLNHLCGRIRFFCVSSGRYIQALDRFLKISFTFIFVSLGWILFRSSTIQQAINIYKSLVGLAGNNLLSFSYYRPLNLILILAFIIAFFLPDTLSLREQFIKGIREDRNPAIVVSWACVCGVMAVFGILCFSQEQYFLYSGF